MTGSVPPKRSFWTKGKVIALSIFGLLIVVVIAGLSVAGGTPKQASSLSDKFMQSVMDGKSSTAIDLMNKDLRTKRGDSEWQSIIKAVAGDYDGYGFKDKEVTTSANKKTTYTRYRYTLTAKSNKSKNLEAEVRINETVGQDPILDGFKLTQVE